MKESNPTIPEFSKIRRVLTAVVNEFNNIPKDHIPCIRNR